MIFFSVSPPAGGGLPAQQCRWQRQTHKVRSGGVAPAAGPTENFWRRPMRGTNGARFQPRVPFWALPKGDIEIKNCVARCSISICFACPIFVGYAF
jgi:hypothetical protein